MALFRRLLLALALQIGGYVCGVRIPPEEIEKILNVMNRVQVVQVVKKDDDVT